MNTTSTQNIWFDDAATSAMGEAFDEACKSLQDFGSAPEIIANLIIAAAKDGERDFVRLYNRALRAFGADDTSTLVVSVGSDRPVPSLARLGHARSVILESPGQLPHPRFFWCVSKLSTPWQFEMPVTPADEAGVFIFEGK